MLDVVWVLIPSSHLGLGETSKLGIARFGENSDPCSTSNFLFHVVTFIAIKTSNSVIIKIS